MFGTQDNQLPICGDIAVDKHTYQVTMTFTDDGGEFFTEEIEAGSTAHAAALAGMLIYAKNSLAIMMDQDAFANFAHNIGEHIIVDVKLIG